ncbi:MAG: DUF58 domain-containing protein [Bdellovibrionales bacterium]|nr:DUF58 domain-containing protein [Bdellovibrionales bacterium]
MSLPPEILKKIKLLEIGTRKVVNNLFSGEYHSAFKGQGMTFAEFREYVPGDDIRSISWPVTARTGKPFIKKFDEEREMMVLLAVDVSGSSDYGSHQYFKGEVFNHLAALISFTAAKNNDPVGLLLFSDQVEHYVPPKKGHGHIHRLMRDLYYFKPLSRKTNLNVGFEHILQVLKKKAHVFIFSDFIDDHFDQSLRVLGNKHDTVAVVINDPTEFKLPDIGVVDLHDAETGELITVDTGSVSFRRDFEKAYLRSIEERDSLLRKSKVERIDVQVGKDFVDPLITFFRRRNRR